MNVDVIIPVLGRPERAVPVATSLWASMADETPVFRNVIGKVRELFVCTADDEAEISELERRGLRYTILPGERRPGDYARKINRGIDLSDASWLFLGADDLEFHPGWLSACVRVYAEKGALVIGTNDLGNPRVRAGMHATHSLVHREYVEQGTIDDPSRLLHEGYDHNCVDVEFVETAVHRGAWGFAKDAHVEHLHPIWRKGDFDMTYTLGQRDHQADLRLLRQRGVLWNHSEVSRGLSRQRIRMVASGGRRMRIR